MSHRRVHDVEAGAVSAALAAGAGAGLGEQIREVLAAPRDAQHHRVDGAVAAGGELERERADARGDRGAAGAGRDAEQERGEMEPHVVASFDAAGWAWAG